MNKVPKSLLLISTVCSLNATAGVWEEREHLERYLKQLNLLNDTVLVQASQSSDPNARISMNYNQLLHDANEIARKIEHHLNTPLEEYRSIVVPVDTVNKTATK